MAISNNYVPVKQQGNGATVNYGAAWPIFAAAYIRVYLESVATGVQVPQALGTDYTLTFDDSGFVVTFLVAPPNTQYVVIGRSIALDQTNPYKTSKGFDGSKIEGSYDKLTGMVQDLDNARQRSLVFPLGDTTSTQLPGALQRANLALLFDALGAPYAGAIGSGATAISAAMTPVVKATTLALARTAMGVAASGVNADITALGAVTGVTATAGDNTTKLATTAYVQTALGGSGGGGFVNKFRNGTFFVQQRQAVGNTFTNMGVGTPAYAWDGWIVGCTGAAAAWAWQLNGSGPAYRRAVLRGNTGVTTLFFKQRIAAEVSAELAGQRCCVQVQVTQTSGGAVVPTLTVRNPTAEDNYTSTTTVVSAVNQQSCPDSALVTLAYVFDMPNGNGALGAEIQWDFGAAFNTTGKAILIQNADIRPVSASTALGLTSTPPAAELRPAGIEYPLNQRYYWRTAPGVAGYQIGAAGFAWSTTAMQNAFVKLPVTMRAAPTVTVSNLQAYSPVGGVPTSSGTISGAQIYNDGFMLGTTGGSGFTSSSFYAFQSAATTSYVEASAEI